MLRVAVAAVDASAVRADAAPAWLGGSERGRWDGLPPAARASFLASRALLRRLLHEASGVPAARWTVSAQAGTAPRVAAEGAAAAHASLSHRLGWVAAAVCDAPVGVDVECVRPPRSDPAERAALMLAPIELAAWAGLPENEREDALLARWTAKEAWFKAMPAAACAWDFRRVVAHSCEPARANVRTWRAPPLHVAVCCGDAAALAAVACEGLPQDATTLSWHVGLVAPGS